eukprot:584314-Prymnesium_polylepis.1
MLATRTSPADGAAPASEAKHASHIARVCEAGVRRYQVSIVHSVRHRAQRAASCTACGIVHSVRRTAAACGGGVRLRRAEVALRIWYESGRRTCHRPHGRVRHGGELLGGVLA